MLTVEVYREALRASSAHPVSILHVPLLELAFQTYQLWLLQKAIMIWLEMVFGNPESKAEALLLLNVFSFVQYFVVFTLRCVFEIAAAGTTSKWYFREEGGSSSSGIDRSLTSIAAAHTKSFGSAVLGGLLTFPILAVEHLYTKVRQAFEKTPIIALPVWIFLWLSTKALAVLYTMLEQIKLYGKPET